MDRGTTFLTEKQKDRRASLRLDGVGYGKSALRRGERGGCAEGQVGLTAKGHPARLEREGDFPSHRTDGKPGFA